MLAWEELIGEPPQEEWVPGTVHAARCGRCGKFTASRDLTVVYANAYYGEIDYVGCNRPNCKS